MHKTTLAIALDIVDVLVNDQEVFFAKDGMLADRNGKPIDLVGNIKLLYGNKINGSCGAVYWDTYVISDCNMVRWVPYTGGSVEDAEKTKKIKHVVCGKTLEEIVKLFLC
ncbi:MAG: hypothetical protein MJY87_06910 [Fibrobacter sp.]|nr:hypothetical protein [Fibrobacter sp.]